MSYLEQHRVVANLPPMPPRFSPRAGREVPLPMRVVRELGLEQTGRVAQRVALAAAALELFTRPAVSLDEAATARLLGLHLSRETALYTVLVGKDLERGFPVRLSR